MALRVTLEGRRIEGVTYSGGRADIIIFSDRLYRYSIYESKRNLTFGFIIKIVLILLAGKHRVPNFVENRGGVAGERSAVFPNFLIQDIRTNSFGLPCRSSVGCLDCVVVNLLLMRGCGRSVGPLCDFDCEHKNRRQPVRRGRFLRR
jgi:hypothetical protein